MFSPTPRPAVAAFLLCAALFFNAGLLPGAQAAGKKKRDPIIAIRFHAEVSGYDPAFAAMVKVGNPAHDVTVEKIPSISEHDIASFYPYKASDGSFSAVLQLDRHGAASLEEVSSGKRGRLLVVVVNGRPVTSLLVDKTIKDGVIFIPLGLTEANIRAMGASFSITGEPEDGKPRRKPAALSAPSVESDLPAPAPR